MAEELAAGLQGLQLLDRCHGVILLLGTRRILRDEVKSIKDFNEN